MTYHETMTLFANAVYAEAHGIGSPEQRAAAWARLREIPRDKGPTLSQPNPHPGRQAPLTLDGAPPCLSGARGCFHSVEATEPRRCPECDGDDYHLEPCRECGGAGEIRHELYGHRSCPVPTVPCPACDGEPEAMACWRCQECGHEEDDR